MGIVNHSCDIESDELGPYLLGHLDDAQSADLADRLSRCPHCAAQVADLEAVVSRMAVTAPPIDEPDPINTYDASLDRGWHNVAAVVERDRRRAHRSLRRRVIGVASAAAVFALIVAGTVWTTADRDPGRLVELVGDGGETASALLDEGPSGTSIKLSVSGLSPDEVYGVWLEPAVGPRLPAGSFRPNDDGTAELSLNGALPLDESTRFGIALLPGGVAANAIDVLAVRL